MTQSVFAGALRDEVENNADAIASQFADRQLMC